MEYGWIDTITPPPGFKLKDYIYAILNTYLFSYLISQIYEIRNEKYMKLSMTNKQVWSCNFHKLLYCINDNSEKNGNKLQNFTKLVRIPYYLHSDNHGNFKEGHT